MIYPTLQIQKIYHVGTLNTNDKNNNSYEGAGLSISNCPSSWRTINPFTKGKTFLLKKNNGLFLNRHSLKEEHIEAIYKWGVENDYVKEKLLYQVETYYDDLQQSYYSNHETYKEALIEADDDPEAITKINGYISTKKLEEETMNSKSLDPLDLLITVYSDKVLNLDGVWWNDMLDIYCLSAPRGVIFRDKLSEWNATEVKDYSIIELDYDSPESYNEVDEYLGFKYL